VKNWRKSLQKPTPMLESNLNKILPVNCKLTDVLSRAVKVSHYKELVPVISYRLLRSNVFQIQGTFLKNFNCNV